MKERSPAGFFKKSLDKRGRVGYTKQAVERTGRFPSSSQKYFKKVLDKLL